MRRLEHGDAAEFAELGGVGLEVEGAGDQGVEPGVGSFARGADQVGAGHGAELWSDEDAGPTFLVVVAALQVASLSANELARPRLQG